MDMNERLNSVLNTLCLNRADFAGSIGIAESKLDRQLKGLYKIDKQEALAIKAVYNINPAWLLTGEGEMFINSRADNKKTQVRVSSGELFNNLSKMQKEVIAAFCSIKNEEMLNRISSIILNQAERERAEEIICSGLKDMKCIRKKRGGE